MAGPEGPLCLTIDAGPLPMFLATARARPKGLRLFATLRREEHRPRSYGPARVL
jgi:hypothetical protein